MSDILIPKFIDDCIRDSKQKNCQSFQMIDAFANAEKQYGTLNYKSLFYVQEMINLLIETDVLIKKGNSLYYFQ
jgi:hypothetical protein